MNHTEFHFRGILLAFVDTYGRLNFSDEDMNHPEYDEDTISELAHWLALVALKNRYDLLQEMRKRIMIEPDAIIKQRLMARVRILEAKGTSFVWPAKVELN